MISMITEIMNKNGLKKLVLLSSDIPQLANHKGKSGSKATVADTGAKYMYEETSDQWYLQS